MTFLTAAEIAKLTDRQRVDAQARELRHLGIPFATRRDGSLVVLLAVVEAMFGATITPRKSEPELMP